MEDLPLKVLLVIRAFKSPKQERLYNALYKGQFRFGKMHGKGQLVYSNGETYVGEFYDDEMHDQGPLTKSGLDYLGRKQIAPGINQGEKQQFTGKWTRDRLKS